MEQQETTRSFTIGQKSVFALLTIVAPGLVFVGWFTTRDLPFDAAAWRNVKLAEQRDVRQRMLRDVTRRSEEFVGKSREAIVAELGTPNEAYVKPPELWYLAAPGDGLFGGLDDKYLVITLDEKDMFYDLRVELRG